MSEDRARILNLIAEGKVTPADGERLLDALESDSAGSQAAATPLSLDLSRPARPSTCT